MEDEQFSDTTPPASLIPPFPRDSRGSLEVFNPSIFSSAAKPTKTTTGSPAFRSQQTWQSWIDPLATTPEPDPLPNLASKSTSAADITTSWMALKDVAHHSPTPSPLSNIQQTISSSFVDANDKPSDDAAQGAAEWGLVLKTDEETGKPQGVGVWTSNGPEDSTSKPSLGGGIEASRRNSKYLSPTWSLMQSSVWGQEDLQVRRLQRVVKENDRVYLMRVPSPGSLPPLPAFSMVKPLAMSEVLDASKEKMFASLVPDNSAKALSRSKSSLCRNSFVSDRSKQGIEMDNADVEAGAENEFRGQRGRKYHLVVDNDRVVLEMSPMDPSSSSSTSLPIH